MCIRDSDRATDEQPYQNCVNDHLLIDVYTNSMLCKKVKNSESDKRFFKKEIP